MYYTITNGVVNEAVQIPSPNFNARPKTDNHNINTIVIHNISLPPNEFGKRNSDGIHYVTALFTNTLEWDTHPYFKSIEGLQVSAHLFIERDGTLTQYVNLNDRAWHAGKSCYLGKSNCNDYSIGIELEGADDCVFTDVQYTTLAKLICAIYTAYPATKRHLTGHSDIAPNRKTDPGTYFDWQHLRKMIRQQQMT